MAGKDSPKKIPKESSKAKLWCDAYLAMGVDRSLDKLSKMTIDGETIVERWLEEWSRRYGWVARAEKYDEEQLKKRRKRREKALDDLYDELALLCQEQRAKTLKDIEKLRKSEKGLGSIASVNLLKLLVDTHIQVLGGNEKQKVELTGKDGGKIEVEETIVETFWGRGTDPRKSNEPAEADAESDEEGDTELAVEVDDTDDE